VAVISSDGYREASTSQGGCASPSQTSRAGHWTADHYRPHYDSLERNQLGDFGYGWSLAIGNPKVESTRPTT